MCIRDRPALVYIRLIIATHLTYFNSTQDQLDRLVRAVGEREGGRGVAEAPGEDGGVDRRRLVVRIPGSTDTPA